MEYTIKHEPITTDNVLDSKGNIIQEGIFKDKYNIYYSDMDQPEFYAYDLNNPQVSIKEGYIKSEISL